jgi:hypothetical protein
VTASNAALAAHHLRPEAPRALLIGAILLIEVGLLLLRLQNVAVPAMAAEREASARLFGVLEERLAGLYRRSMGSRMRGTVVTFPHLAYIPLLRASGLALGAHPDRRLPLAGRPGGARETLTAVAGEAPAA